MFIIYILFHFIFLFVDDVAASLLGREHRIRTHTTRTQILQHWLPAQFNTIRILWRKHVTYDKKGVSDYTRNNKHVYISFNARSRQSADAFSIFRCLILKTNTY